MDMYRILENFDAVNSKQTLAEGDVKRALHKKAERMSKEDFISSVAGPEAPGMNMSAEEATEFWIAVNGDDDEELNEGPYTRLNTYRINGQDMIEYLASQDGAQVEMRGDDVGILVVDIISFPRLAKMAADLAQQGKIKAVAGPATKDMTGKAVRAV